MNLQGVLLDQAGVISRTQALEHGASENDIRRTLRRREWVVVHPGVYINHTGEPNWVQHAWAAVLFAWPAALSHESALRAAEGPGKRTERPIHLAVARDRRLAAPEGVRLHRMSHLQERAQWNLAPPRIRYEDATLDVALAARTDLDAVAALSAPVGARRTTAHRILERLDARLRTPRRTFLAGVLEDVAAGTCSVLEHGYLTLVERAHGLPVGVRQIRATATTGVIYRDVFYGERVIELDGRLSHSSTEQRDRDMDRDLDAAVDGHHTQRIGYGMVFDRPCVTARRVGTLLQRSGWAGVPTTCSPDCSVRGVWLSSSDSHTPHKQILGRSSLRP